MAKAKAIMVQGTMSNAGKSLVAAGLCRIFARDGYKVAPFKSQNMALNSAVTKNGLEMGRAQVMQAEAAGIDPDVRMNPILLKPTSDSGSQVIVMGEVFDTMKAADYYAFKNQLRKPVMEAFDSLAEDFDIIVIEGAGSPAEINLKTDDLANMGMAKMAQAPVLLVGDIDPGGVFAQLYGTMELLDEDEKAMVKGLVINKFRGDVNILLPGLKPLEEMCNTPVVGVLPYAKLDLDDEDSLATRLTQHGSEGILDVAVIRIPHLSNFTDFNEIERHPQMALRYVTAAVDLGRPDLIILPGTKNTLDDLQWLKDSGMAACIKALARCSTPVIGICGGYQMLGEALHDPFSVEEGGDAVGLGLLPMETTFTTEKRRTRIAGRCMDLEGVFAPLSGVSLDGYEIHMGTTTGTCKPSVLLHEEDGDVSDGGQNGNVLGSYLHGFFDAPGVCDKLATALAQARGISLPELARKTSNAYKEEQYDLLADTFAAALDMDAIYRILNEGV